MIIYNIYTNEEINLNDKTPESIMALITSLDLPDYNWACSDEDMEVYGLTRDLNTEEAMDLVRAVHEKATAGTPEVSKKPTVQEELTKANDILEKRIDILHNRLAKVAENFLQEQVQDVIYKTHQQEAFRETVESNYSKVSDLWHTLDDDQKELLSDIMHGLGVSTGMLLSEVFKAGIKACYTHGETLESLNNLETVNVSKVFYDALPTDRY